MEKDIVNNITGECPRMEDLGSVGVPHLQKVG